MQNRETKEVKLPSGKKAILKTYLNAGEFDDIQDVFLGSVDMDIKQQFEGNPSGKFDGTSATKAKYKTLVVTVVKIGDKENLKEGDFRNMSIEDVDFLAKECDKLKMPKKK